uniref:Uncharacterized protein n=2 Tax=Oryza sativa subsp. japonica TaxID=39947 RepID=A0A5S6R8P4_ORYSJ|nr:Hypothetical protein [Oryza sativa Japonica Group]AAP53173.1 hypothetical protein LOC_Os10g20590 [Oryza sativa Japonica Group]
MGTGTGMVKFFHRGDGDADVIPDGSIPMGTLSDTYGYQIRSPWVPFLILKEEEDESTKMVKKPMKQRKKWSSGLFY